MSDSLSGTLRPDIDDAAKEQRLPRWLAALLIVGLSSSLWALVVVGLRHV